MLKKIILTLSLFILCFSVTAQATVSLGVSNSNYKLNEIIDVSVNIQDNDAPFHNLFFNLSFDAHKLRFLGIERGSSTLSEPQDRILHALQNDDAKGNLIVSYQKDNTESFYAAEGEFLVLQFQVIEVDNSGASYSFEFNQTGVYDEVGSDLAFNWNSDTFITLFDEKGEVFMRIVNPLYNESVSSNTIDFDLQYSIQENTLVALKNSNNEIVSQESGQLTGVSSFKSIALDDGKNMFSAFLYDVSIPEVPELLDSDTIVVYKNPASKYIRIESPSNREVVNSNFVTVTGFTEANIVNINGIEVAAQDSSFIHGIYLKPGFNTITASVEVKNEEGVLVKRTDSIDIFYQRSDNHFSIVYPEADSSLHFDSIKTDSKGTPYLELLAEIGAATDEYGRPYKVSGEYIFRSFSGSAANRVKVWKDADLPILNSSEVTYVGRTAFYVDDVIDLTQLNSVGILEIHLTKKSSSTGREETIQQQVFIKDNKPEIILQQPNVYRFTSLTNDVINDELAKNYVAENAEFNENNTFVFNSVRNTDLTPSILIDYKGAEIIDIEEDKWGNLYLLLNYNNSAILFQKSLSDSDWMQIGELPYVFAYDLKTADMGVFIGVSNMLISGTANSGLYYYPYKEYSSEKNIFNIQLGTRVPAIPHIQKMHYQDGMLYLYGDDYSHLISVPEYSLVFNKNVNLFSSDQAGAVQLSNTLFIDEFGLSQSRKSAAILDKSGYLYVYSKEGNGYFTQSLDNAGAGLQSTTQFTDLISIESGSEYFDAFIAYSKSVKKQAYLIMASRSGNVSAFLLDLTSMLPIDEHLYNFSHLDFTNGMLHAYYLEKADDIMTGGIQRKILQHTKAVINFHSLSTAPLSVSADSLTYHIKDYTNDFINSYFNSREELYCFDSMKLYEGENTYPENATLAYEINPDKTGHPVGFRFSLPLDFENYELIKLAIDNKRTVALDSLLADESITNWDFDTFIQSNNNEQVFEFTLADEDAGFNSIQLTIDSLHRLTPELSSLKLLSKKDIEIPITDPDKKHLLPIRGYVTDPSISEVTISGGDQRKLIVPIHPVYGSFSANYELISPNETLADLEANHYSQEIIISSSGFSSDEISFTVTYFESVAKLKNIIVKEGSSVLDYMQSMNTVSVNKLGVTMDYEGLLGAQVGYEIYPLDNGNILTENKLSSTLFDLNITTTEGRKINGRLKDDSNISVLPGKFAYRFFIINPGGQTDYSEFYKIEYQIPQELQKIIINKAREKATSGPDISGFKLEYVLDNVVFNESEVSGVNGTSYVYRDNVNISGRIDYEMTVDSLKVFCLSPGMKINGAENTIIPVNSDGSFSVDVDISLSDIPSDISKPLEETVYLGIVPTPPYLNWMNTAVQINITRDLNNAYIIPNFEQMQEEFWTNEELAQQEKEIVIRIDRFIPDNELEIELIINYDKSIKGILKRNPNVHNEYRILDSEGKPFYLSGIKEGTNIVFWSITHQGTLVRQCNDVSSEDVFTFNITSDLGLMSTSISFAGVLQDYYNNSSQAVPDILIERDKRSYIEVYVNDSYFTTYSPVSIDVNDPDPANKFKITNTIDFANDGSDLLIEGRNKVEFKNLRVENEELPVIEFNYDTVAPFIQIIALDADKATGKVASATVLVKEANIKAVGLSYFNTANNTWAPLKSLATEVDLKYLGDDIFLYTWHNLLDPAYANLHTIANPKFVAWVDDLAGSVRVESGEKTFGSFAIATPGQVDVEFIPIGKYSLGGLHGAFTTFPALYNPVAGGNNNSVYRMFPPDISYKDIGQGIDRTPIQRHGSVNVENGQLGNAGSYEIKAGSSITFGPDTDFYKNTKFYIDTDFEGPVQRLIPRSTIQSALDTEPRGTLSFAVRFEHESYVTNPTNPIPLIVLNKQIIENVNHDFYCLGYEYTQNENGRDVISFGFYIKNEGQWIKVPDSTNPDYVRASGSLNFEQAIEGEDLWELFHLSYQVVDEDTLIRFVISNENGNIVATIPANHGPSYTGPNLRERFISGNWYQGSKIASEQGYYTFAKPAFTFDVIMAGDEQIIKAADAQKWPSYLTNSDIAYWESFGFAGNSSLKLIADSQTYLTGETKVLTTNKTALNDGAPLSEISGALFTSGHDFNKIEVTSEFPLLVPSFGEGKLLYNLDVGSGSSGSGSKLEDYYIFTPQGSEGIYDFSKNDRLNIQNSKYYTIAGTIEVDESKELDKYAEFKLSIDGKDYYYPVKGSGDFVFEVKHENFDINTIPSDFDLDLHVYDRIKLYKNIQFIEGAYHLPVEAFGFAKNEDAKSQLSPAYAKEDSFIFTSQGNIEFDYKAWNTNKNGFIFPHTVNYKEMIFDSPLFKVSIEKGMLDVASYHFYYKTNSDYNVIDSGVPVRNNWQHIQIIYDYIPGNKTDAIFLIDNQRIETISQNAPWNFDLTNLSDFNNSKPLDVFFGADKNGQNNSRGYIDNIMFEHFAKDGSYTPAKDLVMEANPRELRFSTKLNSSISYEKLLVLIENVDSGKIFRHLINGLASGAEELIDISGNEYPAGNYAITVYTKQGISSHNYTQIFKLHDVHRFLYVKNDVPYFDLVNKTPFYLSGETMELEFDFLYDDTYLKREQKSGRLPYVLLHFKHGSSVKMMYAYVKNNAVYPYVPGAVTQGQAFQTYPDFQIKFPPMLVNTDIEYTIIRGYYDGTDFAPLSDAELAAALIAADETDFIRSISFELEEQRSSSLNYSEGENLVYYDTGALLSMSMGKAADQIDHGLLQFSYRVINRLNNQDMPLPYKETTLDGTPILEDDRYKINVELDSMGNFNHEFHYQDFELPYGDYIFQVTLYYDGKPISSGRIGKNFSWKNINESASTTVEHSFKLVDAGVLRIEDDNAYVLVRYEGKTPDTVVLNYSLNNALQKTAGEIAINGHQYFICEIPGPFKGFENSLFLHVIPAYSVGGSLPDSFEIVFSTPEESVPEVKFNRIMEYVIPFNSITIDWNATIDGVSKTDMEYSYDFDNQGETSFKRDLTSIDLFELSEGLHTLKVRSKFGDVISPYAETSFVVDLSAPVIDRDKLVVEMKPNRFGIIDSINVRGNAGAVTDTSKTSVYLESQIIGVNEDGSFPELSIPIRTLGPISTRLIAFDAVGNHTDFNIEENNTVFDLLYPIQGQTVEYLPLTVTGRLRDNISDEVELFISDIATPNNIPVESYKKATVHADRIFLFDDVVVTPGTAQKRVKNEITVHIKTPDGKYYEQDVILYAQQLRQPIELTVNSTVHQGGTEATTVVLHCESKLDVGVSSWSIDYDGDGIYDEIVMADSLENPNVIEFSHMYSDVQEVHPRVSVITRQGAYFTVSEKIIIHEEFIHATLTETDYVRHFSAFVNELKGIEIMSIHNDSQQGSNWVEVHKIGPHDSKVNKASRTIELRELLNHDAYFIKVINKDYFIAFSMYQGAYYASSYLADSFNNFEMVKQSIFSNSMISSAHVKEGDLLVTTKLSSSIFSVPFNEGAGIFDFDTADKKDISFYANNGVLISTDQGKLGNNIAISGNSVELYISDINKNRILNSDFDYKSYEYFGEWGVDNGQFLEASIIECTGQRIFVYDSMRQDIQVFNTDFELVARIDGFGEYLEPDFLRNIDAMYSFTRIENNKVVYHVLLHNADSQKFALLELPQWDGMPASIRNNKLVFLNHNEVYTARPDAADLRRLISTDSLPLVDGTLEYPAMSPDGRSIVFLSRSDIFGTGISGSQPGYNKLYIYNIGSKDIFRIPLNELKDYELERPVYNSDGDKIAFSAKKPGESWQIYECDLRSGGIVPLITGRDNLRQPYYSPDDRFMVYTSDHSGDEEILIIDLDELKKDNVSIVELSINNYSDTYPVWGSVFPYEVSDQDNRKIDSKIAFVSERNGKRQVFYSYIARMTDSDIRVVDISKPLESQDVGEEPDNAAILVSDIEAEYPLISGDGKKIIFESLDGKSPHFKSVDLTIKDGENIASLTALPESGRRPSGMRNIIANLKAEIVDGNNIALNWTPYTENETFYKIQYRINEEGSSIVPKLTKAVSSALISDLQMGTEYLVRVQILDLNGEIAATSLWKKVELEKLVAKPTITVDENNPYLVHLHAWKPNDDYLWKYTWIINGIEYNAATSQDYSINLPLSGINEIKLKVNSNDGTETKFSDPYYINIVSDIIPIIEYSIETDGEMGFIRLSAENSLGSDIDKAGIQWVINGLGKVKNETATGAVKFLPLSDYFGKVNVILRVPRKVKANGQTDVIEVNKTIDLGLREVKPVITYTNHPDNPLLYTFSGADSFGIIDWYSSSWMVMRDGDVVGQKQGGSSFIFDFKAHNRDSQYSVILNTVNASNNDSASTSVIMYLNAEPIKPVVDYELLVNKDDQGNIVDAKLLLSAVNSEGANIDFNSARWNLASASAYGEQAVQIGPTAIYSLSNLSNETSLKLSLTLDKRGGSEPVQIFETIDISKEKNSITELIPDVDVQKQELQDSLMVILDASKSLGANIDWQRTEWTLDDGRVFRGPVARFDILESGEDYQLGYMLLLYTFDGNYKHHYGVLGPLELGEARFLSPKISQEPIDVDSMLYSLSAMDSDGVNIDWERTTWQIYDGGTQAVTKYGAQIQHAFSPMEGVTSYPVTLLMYQKGSQKPFMTTENVVVDDKAAVFQPSITTEISLADPNVYTFMSNTSEGRYIDWGSAKWTFGDGSEYQHGATAVHRFPIDGGNNTYTVTLTLSRRLPNGEVEIKTVSQEITIGADEVKLRIKRENIDEETGLAFFTLAPSSGAGLQLTQASWQFSKQASFSDQNQVTDVDTESDSQSTNVGGSVTTRIKTKSGNSVYGMAFQIATGVDVEVNTEAHAGAEANWNWGHSHEESDTETIMNSVSDQQSAFGISTSKIINEDQYVMVTVYRMLPDGSQETYTETFKLTKDGEDRIYE